MEAKDYLSDKFSHIKERVFPRIGSLAHTSVEDEVQTSVVYTHQEKIDLLAALRPATLKDTEVRWSFSTFVIAKQPSALNFRYTSTNDSFIPEIAYISTRTIVGSKRKLPVNTVVLLDSIANPFIELDGINILNIRRIRIGDSVISFGFETANPNSSEQSLAYGLLMYLNNPEMLNKWQDLLDEVSIANELLSAELDEKVAKDLGINR